MSVADPSPDERWVEYAKRYRDMSAAACRAEWERLDERQREALLAAWEALGLGRETAIPKRRSGDRAARLILSVVIVTALFICIALVIDPSPILVDGEAGTRDPGSAAPDPAVSGVPDDPLATPIDCEQLGQYLVELGALITESDTPARLAENADRFDRFAASLPAVEGRFKRSLDLLYATSQGFANAAQSMQLPNSTEAAVASMIDIASEDAERAVAEAQRVCPQ